MARSTTQADEPKVTSTWAATRKDSPQLKQPMRRINMMEWAPKYEDVLKGLSANGHPHYTDRTGPRQ